MKIKTAQDIAILIKTELKAKLNSDRTCRIVQRRFTVYRGC